MAKTKSRPAADISSLLTSAEKKVLDGSLGASLSAATQAQLREARKLARGLRDKWRDLFSRQTIATKRKPAAAADKANTRSKDKADLFGEAVQRIEARLTELAAGVSAAVAGTKPATKAGRTSAARSVTKSSRQAGHRETRATVRGELSDVVTTMNVAARRRKTAKSKTKANPKASPAAAKAAASASEPVQPTGVASRKKTRPAKPIISKKARQAGKRDALAASGTGQAVAFDVKKQRKAGAKLKAARLKLDGQTTRRKGVVLSNTKRKQARRDSR